MIEYLNWWQSALVLSGLTLGFFWVIKAPMGVSGSWARVLMWKNDKIIKRAEEPFKENLPQLQEALIAATIEEFGVREVQLRLPAGGQMAISMSDTASMATTIRAPWTAHLTFLIMIVVGGFVAMSLRGGVEVQSTLGALHESVFGHGFVNWMILFVGGSLIGFGTQLSNGCTSGHGLSGMARLSPASIAATATFFATAVLISILIKSTAG